MTENELETKSRSLLARTASSLPHASPFLKTRVLADLRERRKNRSAVRRWRLVAAASAAVSAGLIAVSAAFLTQSRADFEAVVGQPYAVRIELERAESRGVQLARIQLPEGVAFYSTTFPEMRQQRSLIVEWDPARDGKLPIVIAGDASGVRTVEIEFLDKARERVSSRRLKIRFMERKG